MNDYQRELDQLDFAYKRYTNTVAGLEAVEANIHRTRKVTLADMQKLERLIPGNTYSNQTLAVAGLCSNTRQDEVTAALEAINWKKVGILGLIAAIIGAIIALIARIRGNSKNVQGVVEKAVAIPKQVDRMEKQIEKDIKQVQAQTGTARPMSRYDDPQDDFENTYNKYADRVEQNRRNEAAKPRLKEELAQAQAMHNAGPLPFGKGKLSIVPPIVDETKMAKMARAFEQRFPIYGKVSTADMSTMLGISEAQLSGSEPFQMDAVLAGLMDNVDQFMVGRITDEKSSNALAARRRMIYVVAVISGAKKTKYWSDIFGFGNKIGELDMLGSSISCYQADLLKSTANDVNTHISGIDYSGRTVRGVWYNFEGSFNESRGEFAPPNRVPVDALNGWARIVSTLTTVDSFEEFERNPEMSRILENSPSPKMGFGSSYPLLIKERKSLLSLANSEDKNYSVDRDSMFDSEVPILDYVREDEHGLKRRATEVLGNSFSLTDFKLKVDAMEDNSDMFNIVEYVDRATKRLDATINKSLTVGSDGKLKNLDNNLFSASFRSSHEEVSAVLRGKAFDFNDPANAEATAAIMKIHHAMNDAPSRMLMGLSKSIARYSEFLNVMANYKTLLSSEYLAMVEFFRSELMKIK